MSNITFGPRLIEQQLAASNRLFRSGYEAGYEAGVKYAIGKFEEMVERMIPASSAAVVEPEKPMCVCKRPEFGVNWVSNSAADPACPIHGGYMQNASDPLDPCDVGSPTDRV